jgi:hypothetical protein
LARPFDHIVVYFVGEIDWLSGGTNRNPADGAALHKKLTASTAFSLIGVPATRIRGLGA